MPRIDFFIYEFSNLFLMNWSLSIFMNCLFIKWFPQKCLFPLIILWVLISSSLSWTQVDLYCHLLLTRMYLCSCHASSSLFIAFLFNVSLKQVFCPRNEPHKYWIVQRIRYLAFLIHRVSNQTHLIKLSQEIIIVIHPILLPLTFLILEWFGNVSGFNLFILQKMQIYDWAVRF